MSKITEAQEILKALGLPAAQQNEMSALTLLALCSIKEDTPWADATRTSQRITKEIMAFVNENYKADAHTHPIPERRSAVRCSTSLFKQELPTTIPMILRYR